MSVLQAAGSSLMVGSPGGGMRGKPSSPTLGIRSLREEYLKPAHRDTIPRNLRLIEERLERDGDMQSEPVASAERLELPRFQHLFTGGELLPPTILMAALELQVAEQINGRTMPYDQEVFVLRDNLIMAYKPIVAKIRLLQSKELTEIPLKLVLNFVRAWTPFESAWLRSRESHAVDALQPLVKVILALEPLLNSVEKERLLPWPRRQHQKAITLKTLEGYVDTLTNLSASVLPSSAREFDHDARLLLLAEHILALRGEEASAGCLEGLSATPEVSFPEATTATASPAMRRAGLAPSSAAEAMGPTSLPLDAYAFKLLGMSKEGAAVMQKLKADSGVGVKETDFQRRAGAAATELLAAFETVKDVLLMIKPALEEIDPGLDRDEAFVAHLQRYERAFRRAKRLFLEPDNLA